MTGPGRRVKAGVQVTVDADTLPSILAVLDRPDPSFNIVTPTDREFVRA